MLNALRRNVLSPWFTSITLFILVVFQLSRLAPDMTGDAPGYVTLHTLRPIVYPLFIWLFHGFGAHQLQLVVWAQSLLAFSALIYAGHWLRSRLGFSALTTFVISLFFILQVFFHFTMMQMIATEAVAFALFVPSFLLLVDAFKEFNLKRLIVLCVFINLLFMTRLQFIYFYALLVVLMLWYVWRNVPMKQCAQATAVILLSIFMTAGINWVYHFTLSRNMVNNITPGTYLLMHALYLADSSDANDFTNPEDKAAFTKLITNLETQQFTKNSAPAVLGSPLSLPLANAYYFAVYIKIGREVDKFFANMPTAEREAKVSNMYKPLYLHHGKQIFTFYCWRVISFFGDISVFLLAMMVLVTMGGKALKDRKWDPDRSQLFVAISLLIILSNIAFINIFEMSENRYLYYCFFIIYCLGGLLAKKIIQEPVVNLKEK